MNIQENEMGGKSLKRPIKNSLLNISIKFLVFMGCCSILSRGMVSITIPVIKVENPQPATITNKLQANGAVQGSQEKAVGTEAGLFISSIAVVEGQSVEKNKVLYTIDKEKLDEFINSKAQELYIMDLQLQDLENTQEAQAEEREIAYQQALTSYEKALESGDETSIFQAEIALELAQVQNVYDSSIEQNRILRDQKAKELEKYQKIQANGYNIISPVDGTITSVKIEVGGTTSSSDILIAEKGTSCKLVVQFDEEDMQYLEVGQSVNAFVNAKEKIEGISINSIALEEEKVNAVITFPQGTVNVGDNVEIEIILKSKEYECCVSRSAIYQSDKDKYFVNTLKEVETILGTQLEIKQVYVEVIDKDSSYVAIEGVTNNQEIVIDSTKEISEGSRVRRQEV